MSACEDWPEPERDPDEAAYELWQLLSADREQLLTITKGEQ